MLGCLLLSHGQLAEAYLEATRRILGECDGLFAINCEAMAPDELYRNIAHLIDSQGLTDGLFILVGLRGGSCWNVAARAAHDFANVELLSGVNLPMVLSFITKRGQYRFGELAQVLLDDGTRGITRFRP